MVARGDLTLTPSPTITGTLNAGKTLTALPSAWDFGLTKSYIWLRNGHATFEATKATYKLKSADKGKKITVSVTGSKCGFISVAKARKPTRAVS